MIVFIDNYDSFVCNLARYFELLGYETRIFRNDAISIPALQTCNPEALVISPGPCTPDEAGISLQAIRYFAGKIPILGICLGHQAIARAFGGMITQAKKPMHGSSAAIHHQQQGLFHGLPNPLSVGRYHSLVIQAESLPDCLEVLARSDEGEIMAIQHRQLSLTGLQFHPESILSQYGREIIQNYCKIAKLKSV